jgi:hypothetical protein
MAGARSNGLVSGQAGGISLYCGAMRSVTAILSGLALMAASSSAWAARPPVVVELFTAQGCSSCGPADEAVAALADRDDVLPLTFSVDYWDYLGWKDTFALRAFTDRQRAYAKQFGIRDVYTPQVVVDGRVQASAAKPSAIEPMLIAQGKARRDPPDMELMQNGRVAVGSGPAPDGGGEVWLVRYDAKAQQVSVRRGDNRGQTLDYRNVVRQLVRLGPWNGRPRAYTVPPAPESGLSAAVLVQGAKGGPIIGVMTLPSEKVEEAEAR